MICYINSEQDIKESKLKVFSSVDQVESALEKGLRFFIKGVTDDQRVEYRNRLLAVEKKVFFTKKINRKDLIQVAEQYLMTPLKAGKTSQVIFGAQTNDLEALVSRGIEILKGGLNF